VGPANASQWSGETEVLGYIAYATSKEKMQVASWGELWGSELAATASPARLRGTGQ